MASQYSNTSLAQNSSHGFPSRPIEKEPSKSTLTFGVEFEFCLAVLGPNDLDPNPNDPRPAYLTGHEQPYTAEGTTAIHQRLIWALEHVGIEAKIDPENDPNVELVNLLEISQLPKTWVIKTDSTIRAPDARYPWYPFEIVSPPLYFTQDSIDAVRVFCQTLTDNFRIHYNRSCGFHVHVGDGVNGFDLPTLKSLFAFLWTFEPQLATIHPPHRLASTWSLPLFGGTVLSRNLNDANLQGRLPGLEAIFTADEINTLVELSRNTGVSHKGGYSLMFQTRPLETKRTIEFRQHKATFDCDAVENWIRVCERLVHYAKNTPIAHVEKFCRHHADRPIEEFTLRNVFEELGLHAQADFYEAVLKRRQENGGLAMNGNDVPWADLCHISFSPRYVLSNHN